MNAYVFGRMSLKLIRTLSSLNKLIKSHTELTKGQISCNQDGCTRKKQEQAKKYTQISQKAK